MNNSTPTAAAAHIADCKADRHGRRIYNTDCDGCRDEFLAAVELTARTLHAVALSIATEKRERRNQQARFRRALKRAGVRVARRTTRSLRSEYSVISGDVFRTGGDPSGPLYMWNLSASRRRNPDGFEISASDRNKYLAGA